MRWTAGWGHFSDHNKYTSYEAIVRDGLIKLNSAVLAATLGDRISAIEHLLDVVNYGTEKFVDRVNDRARWFRVGLRIEGHRFIPVTEEHLHTELVQPALLLLHDPALAEIDALYRKAFDRVLGNDAAGAVTVAVSAVEEMLRLGLDVPGKYDLGQLVGKAKSAGWLSDGAGAVINSLASLRKESDAHSAGTSDFDIGMFAVHLGAAALLHLSRAEPFSR